MLLPIPIIADYNTIRERRQAVIDDNARRENLRRRTRDYHVGDEVLLILKNPDTLQERAIGPYTIEEVHVNGTVTVPRTANVLEWFNIRRLKPYNRRV